VQIIAHQSPFQPVDGCAPWNGQTGPPARQLMVLRMLLYTPRVSERILRGIFAKIVHQSLFQPVDGCAPWNGQTGLPARR
jgi:hypothetical protein